MDQNSLDKLKTMISSALEFGKNEGVTDLSEDVKRKLATIGKALR